VVDEIVATARGMLAIATEIVGGSKQPTEMLVNIPNSILATIILLPPLYTATMLQSSIYFSSLDTSTSRAQAESLYGTCSSVDGMLH
jgi:hypothetical protein